jgi:hypothetical protein
MVNTRHRLTWSVQLELLAWYSFATGTASRAIKDGAAMTGIEPEAAQSDTAGQLADSLTLTDTVNMLFDLRSQADGRNYTPTDFARLIHQETRVKVSHTWVKKVRDGDIKNLSRDSIDTLARFFQVSPAVFFPRQPAEGTDPQTELLAAMADSGVRTIAMLTFGVDDETRRAVTVFLRTARRAQQLDDVADPGPVSPPESHG